MLAIRCEYVSEAGMARLGLLSRLPNIVSDHQMRQGQFDILYHTYEQPISYRSVSGVVLMYNIHPIWHITYIPLPGRAETYSLPLPHPPLALSHPTTATVSLTSFSPDRAHASTVQSPYYTICYLRSRPVRRRQCSVFSLARDYCHYAFILFSRLSHCRQAQRFSPVS